MTTVPASQAREGIPEDADRALRLRHFLAIGTAGSAAFALEYLLIGRPQTALVCGVMAVAFGALRAVSLRCTSPRHVQATGEAVLAVFLGGVWALATVDHTQPSLAGWFLAVTPLTAAHCMSAQAATRWTAWSVLLVCAMATVDVLKAGPEIPVMPFVEGAAAQAGLVVAVCAFAVTARRIADGRAQALQAQAEELAAARDVALRASSMKSAFLANMSHEIRTPMNGVLGMTELLMGTRLDAEQQDFARTVRSSAETLLAIINDILDFSKIEAGKMSVESVDFAIRPTVDDVLALFAERAHAKRLELVGGVAPEVPDFVRGDVTRIRQILCNLVSNAIKFTAEGEIVVTVSRTAERLRFEVADTGIGISAEAQGRLFNAFEQADGSTTRRFGGTGLGLAISRQLVLLMGGDLGVDSRPGAGATFWFELPLLASAPEVAATLGDEALVRQRLAGRRALVVDDNATNRRILRLQLFGWGIDAAEAEDGPAALAHLAAHPCDVVLLDMQMPGMDGLEVARRVQRDVRPAPALLLLSSIGELIARADAEACGVVAVMSKPVRQGQLRDALVTTLTGERPSSPAPVALDAATLGGPAPGLRVLVAEDNPVNLKIALRLLAKLGCEAVAATNGVEAVEAIRAATAPFDVVLMDVQMPVQDGYDATREIRRLEATRGGDRVPIVALTANAFEGDRARCYAAGMDLFLSKPYTQQQLASTLAGLSTRGDPVSSPHRAKPDEDSTPRLAHARPARFAGGRM